MLVPVAGGLIIGLMARYGSEKIRGHEIPEALEAILIGQSRMSPKVAVLKRATAEKQPGTAAAAAKPAPALIMPRRLIADSSTLSGSVRRLTRCHGRTVCFLKLSCCHNASYKMGAAL